MIAKFSGYLKWKWAGTLMWQKAIARMDKYGRREVIDNDWLTREVCYSLICVCLIAILIFPAFVIISFHDKWFVDCRFIHRKSLKSTFLKYVRLCFVSINLDGDSSQRSDRPFPCCWEVGRQQLENSQWTVWMPSGRSAYF